MGASRPIYDVLVENNVFAPMRDGIRLAADIYRPERDKAPGRGKFPAILDDARWAYGMPPAGNANYAWIQHFLHHLAPNGRAGFVMANSASDAGGSERELRKNEPGLRAPNLVGPVGVPLETWRRLSG